MRYDLAFCQGLSRAGADGKGYAGHKVKFLEGGSFAKVTTKGEAADLRTSSLHS